MIIPNGTLEFKTKQVRGADPNTGYPLPPEETWGEPVPCQYYQNSRNMLAQVGKETRDLASYTILIEGKAQGESMRLTSDDGTIVGEFSAVSIEELRAVGQTKIVI